MKNLILNLVILAILLSCTTNEGRKSLPEITSGIDQETEYKDLVLGITRKQEEDSFFVYKAQGFYKEDTVGVQISLRKDLKAGIVNNEMKNVFVRNGIRFSSIGAQSDKLLSAMADLYKVDSAGNKMRADQVTLTCANLNEQDINYNSGAYRFKVFMETEDDNSELFVNFDFTNSLIYLNEKDTGYRKGVLSYLMKK